MNRSQTLLKIFAAAALFAFAPLASAANSKVAPDLQSRLADGDVEVIVQYKSVPTAVHHKKVQARGGRLVRSMAHVKAAHYIVPGTAIEDLANDSEVTYVTPNRPVMGKVDITRPTAFATTSIPSTDRVAVSQ
jgi:hypothetical protein